jgi:hypothetical protein
MLTQLTTVKSRLALDPFDPTFDTILTRAIEAFSARFDRECNRTLARTVDMVEQFSADDLEIPVTCYPIETITRFEIKSPQSGWTVQTQVDYTIRQNCVISLATPLPRRSFSEGGSIPSLARLIYIGGYVLPGAPDPQPSTPDSQPVRLPADLENAIIEQVAFWFLNRDKLGQIRTWPAGGNYVQLADTDLLPSVRATLKRHTRLAL